MVDKLQGMCGHDIFKGSLGLLGFKGKGIGGTFQCVPLPVEPYKGQRNWSHMRSSMHSRLRWPTWSWHPFRATSLCVAGNTNWKRVSSDSLGLAHLYRMPYLSTSWFCSHRNRLNLGGLVDLDCHCSRVPSCGLEMTRPSIGSTCWAWCQSSKVIHVTCWLSWTASRTCGLQL